jgi:glycosyltransferase involved in cell wall biosynthesis
MDEKIKPEISVIICTHNPRKDYLERVLEALRKQTVPLEGWELLVIDNASKENLAESWDLSWHPHGRHVREDQVGLTHARLRAMREAKSDLLLFLDDDNEVFPDYLEQGLKIAADWPILGVWGGQWFAEYEKGMPKDWTYDPWSTHFQRDVWSNNYDRESAPYGGGMFVRSEVAEEYLNSCQKNSLKNLLDRAGGNLASYGDFDIAFTACDLGLGMGRFLALQITHLIPDARTTPKYCAKIREDSAYSEILFRFSRGEKIIPESRVEQLVEFYKEFRMRIAGKDIALALAAKKGRKRALAYLKNMNHTHQ